MNEHIYKLVKLADKPVVATNNTWDYYPISLCPSLPVPDSDTLDMADMLDSQLPLLQLQADMDNTDKQAHDRMASLLDSQVEQLQEQADNEDEYGYWHDRDCNSTADDCNTCYEQLH